MKTNKFEAGDMVEEPVARRVTLPESVKKVDRAEDEHEEEIKRNRIEAGNNPYIGGTQDFEKAAARVKVASQLASTPDSGDMGARSRKMVTADELKKSGFTNLRDYMNAKQGLSRKREPSFNKGADSSAANVSTVKTAAPANTFDKGQDRISKLTTKQKMASGGSVSSRADGIAQRGKTRGKIC
jgi:hypothetical protein